MSLIEIPKFPTYALHLKDNWDGEGDQYFIFAFKIDDVFYSHDTGKNLLDYVGSEIIKYWELT